MEKLTKEQASELSVKYAGKTFVFKSPYPDTLGWKRGNQGTLIRLYHPDVDKIRKDTYDLWQARNDQTKEVCDVWAVEVVNAKGKFIIEEQTRSGQKDNAGATYDNPIIVYCPICNQIARTKSSDGHGECRECGKFRFTFKIGQYYRSRVATNQLRKTDDGEYYWYE